MDFDKYYAYLKEKEAELLFPNNDSHGASMYNHGVECMFNYALIALMQAESDRNEEARKKVSA